MAEEALHRFTRQLDLSELRHVRSGHAPDAWVEPVLRDGDSLSVEPLQSLITSFMSDVAPPADGPTARPTTDRWLAPRVHFSLRLTRVEASDQELWAYLANYLVPDYVAWRWGRGVAEDVNASRWRGPVHKQALARLWWSAELFRNADDYSPVERLLINQDFPNSYVHRVFSRSRPMALGLIDSVSAALGGGEPTSDQINDVARRVNLSLAATSVESATGCHRDDAAAYLAWINESIPPGISWADPVRGPLDGGVLDTARTAAATIGAHICVGAGLGSAS